MDLVIWQPGRERSLGWMDTCICMTESFCSSPETITLLIGYTPIQSKKSLKYVKERNWSSDGIDSQLERLLEFSILEEFTAMETCIFTSLKLIGEQQSKEISRVADTQVEPQSKSGQLGEDESGTAFLTKELVSAKGWKLEKWLVWAILNSST